MHSVLHFLPRFRCGARRTDNCPPIYPSTATVTQIVFIGDAARAEFANRLKRLNLGIFIDVIMGIFSYLANLPDVLYGTMIYERVPIQKDGLQKRP